MELALPALYIEKRDIILLHNKTSIYIKNKKKEDDPYSTYYYRIILPWKEGEEKFHILLCI